MDTDEEANASEQSSLLKEIPEGEKRKSRQNPHALGNQRKSRSLFSIPVGKRKTGQHHRHKSSLGQIMDSLSEGLESISEGLQLEAKELKEAWKDKLENADQGGLYYLDMSMTRSLSVLPEEITDFVQEATGVESHVEAPPEASQPARYAALLGAVLAVSSNGTALSMLYGVEPAMKLYWRMTATAMVLSTFALRSVYKDGFPKLTFGHAVTFVGSVFCFFLHTLLFFTALEYTSIGNAVIGANSQALLLIIGKFLVGEKVLMMEGGGVLLAFSGCVLCSQDEASNSEGDADKKFNVFGDLLALASAVAGVGYLTFAKAVRSHMSVIVFMFLVMACGSILVLVYMVILGMPLSLSNDANIGIFGWLNLSEHRLWIVIHIAVVCNVFGSMGFVRAMQYFDNIIIAVATLLEPMAATLIAYSLHVGSLPGIFGWVGNALVVIGTLLVVYPSVDKPTAH